MNDAIMPFFASLVRLKYFFHTVWEFLFWFSSDSELRTDTTDLTIKIVYVVGYNCASRTHMST